MKAASSQLAAHPPRFYIAVCQDIGRRVAGGATDRLAKFSFGWLLTPSAAKAQA